MFKDWGGRLSIGLVYPNAYAVGMSNLGFQTLYGLLNRCENIVCERVFIEGHEPVSLESERPLGDFDALAFSFSYEQDYFSSVELLKSSGIPDLAADREERHPLCIAGGAAVTANPEPLAPIMDAFAIGEAEAILPGLVAAITRVIDAPREDLLRALSGVPGVYVPVLDDSGTTRQYAPDLHLFTTGSEVLTRETELGDMYLMEIARGCARSCRFCLAGHQFGPMRYRPVEQLVDQARSGMRFRQRLGLVSAAISDYPGIDDLVVRLRGLGAEISASSIRIKPLSEALLRALAESNTRTVTLAPEAGSERLRGVIAKGITKDDVLRAVELVAKHGFRQMKLYFMIGLPTETDDDIVDVVNLTLAAKNLLEENKCSTHLVLNLTPFVPKAGTPFQWAAMASEPTLRRRLGLVKRGVRGKGVEVKSDSLGWSLVQGHLSRGDRRMGEALRRMGRRSLGEWARVLDEVGIDAEWIHRDLPADARLPWARIDSGNAEAALRAEFEKAGGAGAATG